MSHLTPVIPQSDSSMKITAIVAPFDPSPSFPLAVAPRHFDAVDEFVKALGQAAGIEIPVIEGTLGDAPREGYLILFDAIRLAEQPSIASRAIVMNADRSTVIASLERDRTLGAVEKHRYFMWRTKRTQDNGMGLFGQKTVISSMGATLVSGPFQSEHYGLAASSSCKDLPSLICAYLSAHSALGAAPGAM